MYFKPPGQGPKRPFVDGRLVSMITCSTVLGSRTSHRRILIVRCHRLPIRTTLAVVYGSTGISCNLFGGAGVIRGRATESLTYTFVGVRPHDPQFLSLLKFDSPSLTLTVTVTLTLTQILPITLNPNPKS